ncbi:hypothetical protein NKI36_01450 [Mesorhizobium caraganae]|uniref:Uncharacterized protein n=1 Tax=Mesorhizobium caraganae TaxID=483206 RepID=A0ABV1YSM7_9HYPH
MRSIIASDHFSRTVLDLGGYRAIDEALEPIIEGLRRNPYGFERFENDHISFRYARTKSTGWVPALVVIFSIDENKNVVLEHVEKDTYAP